MKLEYLIDSEKLDDLYDTYEGNYGDDLMICMQDQIKINSEIHLFPEDSSREEIEFLTNVLQLKS